MQAGLTVVELHKEGQSVLVGIDEAGRGALAGPVVACACALPKRKRPKDIRIDDSKRMTADQREASFQWISKHCVYGVGVVSAAQVDSIGILACTEIAMQQAVAQVAATAGKLYLLVDGRDAFWFDHPHSSVVRGDQSEPCIAAASIVAKVTRDRLMTDMDAAAPGYGFADHKGYGTSEHYAAIRKHGCCPEHRRTFLTEFLQDLGTSTNRMLGMTRAG